MDAKLDALAGATMDQLEQVNNTAVLFDFKEINQEK